MSEFCIGQRWISNTEANLGLGIVIGVQDRRVTVLFPAVDEERVYAMLSAPLSRIRYKKKDAVKDKDQREFIIQDVHDNDGILLYQVQDSVGEEHILSELDLDAFVHFSSPRDRLLSGQIDPLKFFTLRQDTIRHMAAYQMSDSVGLLGPRVQLLPHQLYIAHQVASRQNPRVLLADEVGLGKTIEAGLIIHQQLQAGASQRVLILVPDSLLHQWLVEMLRRFNLSFSVLDEAICLELEHEQSNPFETRQLVLAPLSFLTDNHDRQQQALSCEWDLLVVDEAHHLGWSDEDISDEYRCVEKLAAVAKGVLLLTATPEQLGLESHFARLRLLDPDRYFDLQTFINEEQDFKQINHIVEQLQRLKDTDGPLPAELDNYLESTELEDIHALLEAGEREKATEQGITALLDRHGTGRVLFRNTRHAVQGFPKRKLETYALPYPLPVTGEEKLSDWLSIENLFGPDWIQLDDRVSWLTNLLRHELQGKKVLLICAQAKTAIQLEEHLRVREGIRASVFHEGLSLIARDRAAAYFADQEASAQILICSEIGSEGRNFQFAQHIILFDLPLNPDLLEQRIGRLDRIGQQRDIHIHVPYYEDTPQEILLDWFHQGLNAFEQTCAIGHSVFEAFEAQLLSALQSPMTASLEALIKDTSEYADNLRTLLQEGRDKLLELNSCRPNEAEVIIDNLVASENRRELADYLEKAADQLGIDIEPHDLKSIILRPSETMRCGLLPGMKDEGATYTFSRDIALSREDMGFITWEHPMIQASMEHILSSEHGNTALATIKLKPLKAGTLLLETLYTVNSIAARKLGLYRFLPMQTVRFLVNIEGKDLSRILTEEKMAGLVKKVPIMKAQALAKQIADDIETMAEQSEILAMAAMPDIKADAMARMQVYQEQEITRLEALSKVNPNIRQDEITAIRARTADLRDAIEQSELALDAIRVIVSV